MVAPLILIEAQPRRAADGVAEAVRLAGGGASKPYYYNNQHWRAGVASLPTIITKLDFPGNDLGTGGIPQALDILWTPAQKSGLDGLAAYYWGDALLTVRIGPEGAFPAITMSARVLEATVDDKGLLISIVDPAADLKRPLLTERFGGTGGIEGPAEWEGQIRRRAWGRVFNVEGLPIDKANNIYCFGDPQRQWQSIDAVRDQGADAASLTTLAWQGSVAATFTALQAAAAPAGGGVRCPSIACVKWWTQAGDLAADIKGELAGGYVETAAEIAQKIVSARSALTFAAGTVATAAAARAGAAGWFADDEGATVESVLNDLLGGVSLLWVLGANSEITIRQWTWGASAAAAKSQSVQRKRTIKPFAVRRLGYKRNQHAMARGDIAEILFWSEIDSTNKPSDGATTDLRLSEISTNVLTIIGNTIKQTTGTGYYCAIGQKMSGPCFAEADIVAGNWTMVNLDRDASGADYALQDMAIHYHSGNGSLNVYLGAGTSSYALTIATGLTGKLRGAFDGDRFRVFTAGAEYFTDLNDYPYFAICVGNWDGSGLGPNYFPKWQAYNNGQLYSGLRIGAFADNTRKTAFALVAIGTSPPSIHGNYVVSRTSATHQSSVRGPAWVGSIYAECDIIQYGANYTIIGLDQVAAGVLGAGAEDLYVQYQFSTGLLYVIRKGVAIIGAVNIGAGITGKLGVGYDGVRYRAWVSGVEYAPSATNPGMLASGPGLTHYPKWSPYSAVSVLTGIDAYPFTESDYSMIGGPKAPENGGTAGQNVSANGNAESGDFRGWRKDANFSSVGSTFEFSAVQKQSGAYSWLLHKTATANASAAVNRAFAAKPGDRFLVRLWVYATSAAASGFYAYMLGKAGVPSDGFVDTLTYTTSPSMAEAYGNSGAGNIGLASGVNTFDWDWTVPSGWTGCQFVSLDMISNPNCPVDLYFEVQIFPQAPGTQLVDPTTGRILDGKTLNPSNNFGLRSLATFPTITDTYVSGSTVTLNIPSSTFYGDWGGTITYPSGSIAGAAFATKYYIWRNVGNDPTSTGTSYGSSTNLQDALGAGKVYLGYFTTRSSGPTPPPPPPPPPGGGDNCVDADALVLLADGRTICARDIAAGDMIVCMSGGRDGIDFVEVESNQVGPEHRVSIVTESGIRLSVANSTPMELGDGTSCKAPDCLGELVPVLDHGEFRWELVVSVEPDGFADVAHIRCQMRTYAAGEADDGRFILTHNPNKP